MKQEMYKRRIQVEYKYTQGDFVTYKYILNGKVEEVPFYKYKLKKDVEDLIKNYLLEIKKPYKRLRL